MAEGYAALLECIGLVPEAAVALRVRLTTGMRRGWSTSLAITGWRTRRLAAALEGLEDKTSPDAAALMIELAVDGVYRMQFSRDR